MLSVPRPLLCLLAIGFVAGCTVKRCDEFAAPLDRAPGSCSPKPETASSKPPPGEADPKARRYCYATLAEADCFTTPQPGRSYYLGSSGGDDQTAGKKAKPEQAESQP
jgi:hypothetical protein